MSPAKYEIIQILLKAFDMEKGGDINVASKLNVAADNLDELFADLNKENETNKALLRDARNYIINTDKYGIDRETMKARADQYREILKNK